MSRAAQSTTRNLTDQQLAQQNQLISQSNQQGQQDRSLLMPTITGLLNSPGYTPQQQSAITQQSLGAANTAFDALRQYGEGPAKTGLQREFLVSTSLVVRGSTAPPPAGA